MAKLPDFIVIGAAKSGTTSLFKYFENDDTFFSSSPKEPEYFARDDIYDRGAEWYSNLFLEAQEDQLCCEASTIYSLYPMFNNTASRMHQMLPDVKLVYIMRNPVSRAYSFYIQMIKSYQNCYQTIEIPKTFEEFLFDSGPKVGKTESENLASFQGYLTYCPELLTAAGMYMDQINEYLKYYRRSDFHFMVFEDFVSNPLNELIKLYKFLGADTTILEKGFEEIYENISDDHFQSRAYSKALKKLQENKFLFSFSKIVPGKLNNYAKIMIRGLVKKNKEALKIKPKPMEKSARTHLTELYQEPNKRLSQFLDRDMVKYWSK